ncbi:glycosyltransferase family 2 protein [Magnetospirillum fulvum]|uniref:Dolichol-phosphate mannosyltransferase n=1 Tax=Magnetospirillum fulvum TaxID=1082 RepID=A0A1H6H3C7_MAGFU|nr:glycosyltransferase family 2 protein [Magnetospirillum fulvum]SEH30191.1 dolichol-phosphate mannosyltransferase [Magnetospirillum fulvum]
MSDKVFSIVVPVYENALNLPDTIPQLVALRDRLPNYQLELLFVEDGSRDPSYAILCDFQRRYPDLISVVKLTRNFGQIAALNVGLQKARGDCVGIISADLQDPCEMFVDMIREWENGALLVMGERVERFESRHSVFLSNLFWRTTVKVVSPSIPPGGYDFCLVDRKLVDDVLTCSQAHINIFVSFAYFGYRTVRLPYTRAKREKGKSQWTWFRKVDLLLGTLFSFTSWPIKVGIYVGSAICVLSILYALLLLGYALFFGNPVQGWTTIVFLVLLFGGINTLFLGLIGEYVWQLVAVTCKRPEAVIESFVRQADDTIQGAK